MSLEDLEARRTRLKRNSDITLKNMQKITDESLRVAEVAHNSERIINDLEKEFESQTGLQGNDIKFLFVAIGLQLARIVIVNELTKIEPAGQKNKKEEKLHDFQAWLLGKFKDGDVVEEYPYYASMQHIVSRPGVPYDATSPLTPKLMNRLSGKGNEWNFNIEGFIPVDESGAVKKLGLFKGANHRFATLGHDPVLGLLFGTGNIMTNTITCVKNSKLTEDVGIPLLTTNHVVFTKDYKHPSIATYGSTTVMIGKSIERAKEQPSAFVASLIKQIIHIGTDLYTPCGIQIPGANLVLTNTKVEELTSRISTGDIVKIGTSAGIAELINLIISTIHTLMYDSSMPVPRDLYNIRTRKIITYSNLIASASNVIWVGGKMITGDKTAIRQLDIGGLLVTVKRLIFDKEYIKKIKEEFIFGNFNQMIQGEDLDLEEVQWN